MTSRASLLSRHWLTLVLLVCLSLFASPSLAAASVSASPPVVPAGATMVFTWSGIGTPTSTDWIGVYVPGAPDSPALEWRYTTGTASGNVTHTLSGTRSPGEYELRLFANDGYTRLATSGLFTVIPPSLAASPPTRRPGDTLTLQWSGVGAPASDDWIGIYTPGAADSAFQEWRYTTGGPNGTVTLGLAGNKAPGTYEARLFHSSYIKLATSNTFVVHMATLAASPASVARGASLTATWTGIPVPTASDWIGLFTPGAADTAYLVQQKTTGTASGNIAFTIPATIAAGTYQFRLFEGASNGWFATSGNFSVTDPTLTVTPATIGRGGSVTVSWSGIGAPAAGDWVGLFTPNASDTAYVARQDTTSAASGSMSFTIAGSVVAGTYQMRLFNAANVRLTTSGNLSVIDPSVSATPDSVAAGVPVTASWRGIGTPTATDWVGLYTPGAADTAYIVRQDTTGTATGNVAITVPGNQPPGTYELRLFANNTYTRLATSDGFTVETSTGLSFIYTDHLNTPRAITNNVNQLLWRWEQLDPFGVNAPNENPSGLGTFTCNLRLPGQYFDSETGLHYNILRDYDPSTARYVQSDPIGLRAGINTYAYANANPLSNLDPYGLKTFKVCGAEDGPKFPDNFGPYRFTQACINHDACYDDCVNRPTRAECDQRFFNDVLNACNQIPLFFKILGVGLECVDRALQYAVAVEQLGGKKAFDVARAKCPPCRR